MVEGGLCQTWPKWLPSGVLVWPIRIRYPPDNSCARLAAPGSGLASSDMNSAAAWIRTVGDRGQSQPADSQPSRHSKARERRGC